MTGLPPAPEGWNISRLTEERTQAVAAFGFTERQARFLFEVMIHSGVFVERQYCTFAGIVHGQKTTDFLRKLVERGYARPIQVGPLHRGRLFHLAHKPLYAAIGQTDNRHRKPMPVGRMIERVMVLDAVLEDRTLTWLGTEQDKRVDFMSEQRDRLQLRDFPRLTFGSGAAVRHRYFPDKLPIGFRDYIDHVFVYLVTKPTPLDFRLFLYRHAELLRALTRWTVRVLVPQPFAGAIRVYGHAAREELATPIVSSTVDHLRWYFRERQQRARNAAATDDTRFHEARAAFRAPRFRALYRLWEQYGDAVILAAQSPGLREALARREGRVEFVKLAHQYLHLSSLVGVA